MFLQHFKMKAHPFAEHPPLEHLLKDERVEQGLARLQYLLEAGTVAVVIGPTGVGKSSLLRLFMNGLSRHRYRPLYLHMTMLQSTAFLRLLVSALGEKPRIGKDRLFLQIMQKVQDDPATILIVDEAHLLTPEALIDLRLLISSALEQAPHLKIVLVAQEQLQTLLARASHLDLAHRISVRYHIRPFTQKQSCAYIDGRLRAAGASDKIFESEAKKLIHDFAGGASREINNIATACLINAVAKNLQKINEAAVNEAMAEFRLA